MFLVLDLNKEIKILTSGFLSTETKLTWAENQVGAMPVFGDKSSAISYAESYGLDPENSVIPLSVQEKL